MKIRNAICITTLMIAIDQSVKLIVFRLYMGVSIVLVPHVFLFRPVQNKNLSYLGSLLETKVPLAVMVLIEIVGGLLVVLIYRYCLYLSKKHRELPVLFLLLGLAGITCGFIDNVFWGGSIDFVRLVDWFTFDIKDIYLSSMSALMILSMLFSMPDYYKLSKDERRKYDLIRWVKNGCPTTLT